MLPFIWKILEKVETRPDLSNRVTQDPVHHTHSDICYSILKYQKTECSIQKKKRQCEIKLNRTVTIFNLSKSRL